MTRLRRLAGLLFAVCLGILAGRAAAAADLEWRDARQLTLEGQAWPDVAAPFDRLPARAEKLVRPPVWNLSRQSAGLMVRFRSDARMLQARWTLTSSNLAMPHMPATGVSGLDLYVRRPDGRWSFLANGRPTQQQNAVTLVQDGPAGTHDYLLYLPLYNGVQQLEIGVPGGALLEAGAPRPVERRRPIIFWGTSITQGGCASRPGMVHTAILGRRLDYPVVNLGFSGNGKMEAELGQLIGEIDAAALVLDCLPNMTAEEVTERTVPLVKIFRQARPALPILLVEDRSYSDSYWLEGKRRRNETSRAALRAAFEQLQRDGVARLYYVAGDNQLGDDAEGTVDTSHPTDLGFVRLADALTGPLQQALRDAGAN